MSIRVTDAPLPPAQVLLMIPRNADLSGMKKYPLLVNVYVFTCFECYKFFLNKNRQYKLKNIIDMVVLIHIKLWKNGI